jgi:hypothetical protein
MNLLLLPGNSPDHKTWIHEVGQQLKTYFEKIAVIEYDSWKTGAPIVDVQAEIKKSREVVKNWQEYCIFAKSVGVAIAVKAIKENAMKPSRCVFIGSPFLWTRENSIDLDSWITGHNIPTLFIQQQFDPCMPSSQLKDLLTDIHVVNYTFVEVEGKDHKYSDLLELTHLTRNFLLNSPSQKA